MKRYGLIVLLMLLMPSRANAGDVQKHDKLSGQLKVTIVSLKDDEGTVRIGLFDSNANYASKDKPFKGLSVDIKEKKAECTFEEIPYGTYALKAYHDKNANGELDTNFLGIPKEPYGFSHTTGGKFGQAKWDDAKFVFDTKSMSIEIEVK